nr:MAG TPA: hypothetical protein [Caudoviricetes sp.]
MIRIQTACTLIIFQQLESFLHFLSFYSDVAASCKDMI